MKNSRKIELFFAAVIAVAMVLLIGVVQQAAVRTPTVVLPEVDYPPIAVFPDFASITNIEVKKRQFFDYLQDFIDAENSKLRELRKQLLQNAELVNSGTALSGLERTWLGELAVRYRLDPGAASISLLIKQLLYRVDEIPASLVLAQAANESAWGTSRFALEGNNLFGQWCFKEGCGIVPLQRSVGARHEVRKFDSVESAVEAYFLNINTHSLYDYLRELRLYMRMQEQDLDPMLLAVGLGKYSERGEHYIDEVQTLITQNHLRRRDRD